MQLSTSEFIAKYSPAYEDSWTKATRTLMIEDQRILNELRSCLPIREPVIVNPVEMIVLNGMHRTVLSILDNLPTITFEEQYPDDSSFVDLQIVFRVISGYDEDNLDWLSSFKLTDDVWVNIEVTGLEDDIFRIWSDWNYDPEQLAEIVIERCSEHSMIIEYIQSWIQIEG